MNKSNIHLRYQGYVNTPHLWKDDLIGGLQQFVFERKPNIPFNKSSITEIRLGKLIEHFVLHELIENEFIDIIASNIQLIEDKITVGEIDALIKYFNDFIHLEIIYKFYLYDPTIKTSEIDKWIGPNRNDSLSKKIHKLKTKQFPILSHPIAKNYIRNLHLNYDIFFPKVLFKAQLFVPFNMLNNNFELVNNQCIKGFYLSFEEVRKLNTTLFYVPSKLDWLIEPQINVDWLTNLDFIEVFDKYINLKRSPLCWIKNERNELRKIFVVSWFM